MARGARSPAACPPSQYEGLLIENHATIGEIKDTTFNENANSGV